MSDYNVAFILALLFLTKTVRNLIICVGNENIPLLVELIAQVPVV